MAAEQTNEWLSDLIKIGVPSTVAIVAAIIAYIQSRNSNHLTLTIERMKLQSVGNNALAEKKRELCLRTSESIISLRDSLDKYTTAFGTCIKALGNDDLYEPLLLDTKKQYTNIIDVLTDSRIRIVATARMIGSKELDSALLQLLSNSYETVHEYGHTPTANIRQSDVIKQVLKVDEQANKCLDVLMKVYNSTTVG